MAAEPTFEARLKQWCAQMLSGTSLSFSRTDRHTALVTYREPFKAPQVLCSTSNGALLGLLSLTEGARCSVMRTRVVNQMMKQGIWQR